MQLQHRWTGVTAVLLVLALSGCTSPSAAPKPLATESPSPSVTTTASPSPAANSTPPARPHLPEEATGTSEASAIAFVEEWVRIFNSALSDGRTAVLDRQRSPLCVVCRTISQSISKVYDAGGELRGSGWRAETIQYLARQPRRAPVLRVVMEISPQIAVPEAGAEPRHFEGGRFLYTFHLERSRGGWIISNLELAT